MKFVKLLLAFFIFTTHTTAQKNHFIYLQTENRQPFYVRSGERILSSSSSGYVVIPKLKEGRYDLYIGFPKNEWPRQKITVKVANDAGYLLKNFDSKGWGLFNLQTMEIVMAEAGQANAAANAGTQDDGFASVLADVVNNPSIKQKKENKVTNTEAPKQEQKAAPVEENKTVQPAEEKKPVLPVTEEKPTPAANKPAVQLLSTLEHNGRRMIYLDIFENKVDTVRIFIPYTNVMAQEQSTVPPADTRQEAQPLIAPDTVSAATGQPAAKTVADVKTSGETGLPVTETVKDEVVVPAGTEKNPPVIPPSVTINTNCKGIATADDFLKLRKKMAAQKTDDNMIVAAKKVFVTKCFTTEQVGNLGSLFLSDAGRYNFFDAAYTYINDPSQFGSLVSKLSEEYYINRFRAMIRK